MLSKKQGRIDSPLENLTIGIGVFGVSSTTRIYPPSAPSASCPCIFERFIGETRVESPHRSRRGRTNESAQLRILRSLRRTLFDDSDDGFSEYSKSQRRNSSRRQKEATSCGPPLRTITYDGQTYTSGSILRARNISLAQTVASEMRNAFGFWAFSKKAAVNA